MFVCVKLHDCIMSSFFFFFFHLADSHTSHPPSMCVKREPHEASFAPFTPSSVEDTALADILPHQSSLSVDACTPSYPAHAHSYSQYANQPFIAGTTSPRRPHNQIKNLPTSVLMSYCLVISDIHHLSHYPSKSINPIGCLIPINRDCSLFLFLHPADH